MNKFIIVFFAVALGVVVGVRVEKAIPEQHAVLEVFLTPYAITANKDEVLLSNALSKGGRIDIVADSECVEFLREFDSSFDEYGTLDRENKYKITWAIINWISSKGWKLIRDDSAAGGTYIFIK